MIGCPKICQIHQWKTFFQILMVLSICKTSVFAPIQSFWHFDIWHHQWKPHTPKNCTNKSHKALPLQQPVPITAVPLATQLRPIMDLSCDVSLFMQSCHLLIGWDEPIIIVMDSDFQGGLFMDCKNWCKNCPHPIKERFIWHKLHVKQTCPTPDIPGGT